MKKAITQLDKDICDLVEQEEKDKATQRLLDDNLARKKARTELATAKGQDAAVRAAGEGEDDDNTGAAL